MAKVTRFEDLKCWQLARELVRLAFQAREEGKLAKDFETRGQLKRAALSTMNNIAEGFGKVGSKDFIRFSGIAQSSSIEVKSITYALEDMEYIFLTRITLIREKAEETKNSTLAFIRYLRKRENNSSTRKTPQHLNTLTS
jgi:four helix bundle protein